MNNEMLITIANNVRNARLRQGLSQEKLAEYANVHRTYIGMVERYEKNISILSLVKIAEALKVSPKELLEREQ